MNWKRFFLNLGGAAAAGFGAAVAQTPTGAPLNKTTVLGAILLPVIGNVVGLFQQPPHQDVAQ